MQIDVVHATLRRMIRLLTLMVVFGTLAACSSHTAPDTAVASSAPAPAVTNVLAGTPMAEYGHALNKARNVQNIVDQQAKKQAEAINAATGSTSGMR